MKVKKFKIPAHFGLQKKDMKVKKFKIPFAHFGLHAKTQSRNLAIHFYLFLKCKRFVDKKTPKKKKKKH
jgi:hypothetical protein